MTQLSCAWARVCKTEKPDHLSYEMESRYCIKCSREHWFFTKKIEFQPVEFDPNQFTHSELIEMGYFDQFDDAVGKND